AQRLNLFETLAAPAGDPMLDLQPALRTSRVLAAHGVATGRGVRVAVVDSGIDSAHTELAGAVAATRNLVGGVDEVGAVVPERHGTAMAGVIAARRGNARGIVGVAPDAAILGLRACAQPAGAPRGRCTSFTVARALNAAFALDADIVNLSFAGPYDPTLARFIDAAEAEGRVLVAARADDDTAAFPAAAPTVLAVERARADAPDPSAALPAPGDDVVSTTPGDGYGVFGGASLAAAHVSGLAALVLQAAPALDPVDVRAVLTRAVRRGPGDAAVVDACRALAAAVDEAGATVPTICATS
ncbi:MAG: S8 family serine peptidase, partial [Alphaproteobacteria bacterium]|nr:S8 family serine peptidase [Alphaproteobacteria bacterium]